MLDAWGSAVGQKGKDDISRIYATYCIAFSLVLGINGLWGPAHGIFYDIDTSFILWRKETRVIATAPN